MTYAFLYYNFVICEPVAGSEATWIILNLDSGTAAVLTFNDSVVSNITEGAIVYIFCLH